MKITCGISVYWPSVNGASTYAHELTRAVAQVHRVEVITQSNENRHDWLYTPTLDSRGGCEYYDGKAKVHLLGPNGFEKFLLWPAVNLYYSLHRISFKILCWVFRKKILSLVKDSDILHNYLLDMDYFNYLLYESASGFGIPYIVTPFVHNSNRWQDEFSSLRFELVKKADAIITLTQTEKDWLGKLGLDIKKIHVVSGAPVLAPNYDAESFREKYHINGNMVLFIAAKRRYKGYPLILEAMKYVWTEHPDTYFVFIGLETAESSELFSRYKDGRVIDIGVVDLEEKTSALSACDIFCMPSTAESFGIVFVEAWAMSKPVIGGDCLSTREVIDDGKNGFIVVQEPKALAEKITLLLNDGNLRREMGEAGRQKVLENYTWERAARKLENIYLGLLAS